MTNIDPLTVTIQRALPLVYDDSLSYLELLAKVVAKVNELTASTNLFLSQDLQSMVNAKLLVWQGDGTLESLINAAAQGEIDANKTAQDIVNAAQAAINSGKSDKYLIGKKVAVIGDSIAAGIVSAVPPTVTGNNWPALLAALTGATVTNLAISATCLAKFGSGVYDPLSGYALAVGTDWSQYDYLMIAYGTNDYGNNIPLGTDAASDVTFRGALHHILATLSNNFPLLQIIVLTPVYGLGQLTRNGAGLFREDYSEALTQVATRYNVPVIDLTHELGINAYNYSDLYWDGTHHPSEATQIRMSRFIARVFPGKIGTPARALTYKGMTLINGAAVSGSYPAPCAALDATECVHMTGRVLTPAAALTVCFVLPENCRPAYELALICLTALGTLGYMVVSVNGEVKFDQGSVAYALESVAPFHAGTLDVVAP